MFEDSERLRMRAPLPNERIGQPGVRCEQQAIHMDVTEGRSTAGQAQRIPNELVTRQAETESRRARRTTLATRSSYPTRPTR
jgi:hypothetical protein